MDDRSAVKLELPESSLSTTPKHLKTLKVFVNMGKMFQSIKWFLETEILKLNKCFENQNFFDSLCFCLHDIFWIKTKNWENLKYYVVRNYFLDYINGNIPWMNTAEFNFLLENTVQTAVRQRWPFKRWSLMDYERIEAADGSDMKKFNGTAN